MKNKKKLNICYVFSQSTLDEAITKWVEAKSEKKPKDHEQYSIAAVAIPWFLIHLNQTHSIFTFSYNELVEEIDIWKSAQISEYPKQKKRIETSCNEIIDFFESDVVLDYKMSIPA